MDTIVDAATTLPMNLSAAPSVPIAAWMGGRYDAEPVGATEVLDHCSTCKTVWPVSLLTYDGQEEWHCPGCAPAKSDDFTYAHAYSRLEGEVEWFLRGSLTYEQLRRSFEEIRARVEQMD